MRATTDLSAFLRSAEPGDLIMAANGSVLARAIRILDQADYNHAIVYAGYGTGWHAYPKTDADHHVSQVDVASYFADSHVEAATLLQADFAVRDELLRRVEEFGAQPKKFALNNLLLVAALKALSFEAHAAEASFEGILGDQSCWEALLVAHLNIFGANEVTCAEAVYRCLPDPATTSLTYTKFEVLESWRLAIDNPSAAALGAELVQFVDTADRSLFQANQFAQLFRMIESSGLFRDAQHSELDCIRVVLQVLDRLIDRYLVEFPLTFDRLAELDEIMHGVHRADLITPGDLLRSPEVFARHPLTWQYANAAANGQNGPST